MVSVGAFVRVSAEGRSSSSWSAGAVDLADRRYIAHIVDTASDNASPMQPQAPVGYIEHAPTPASDSDGSGRSGPPPAVAVPPDHHLTPA